MTDYELQKALTWFRSREKVIPMPGAKKMYQTAIEALKMVQRAEELLEAEKEKDATQYKKGRISAFFDVLGINYFD